MSDDVLSSEFDQRFALALLKAQHPEVFAKMVDKVTDYHRRSKIREDMPPHSPVEHALLPGESRDINQVCWYSDRGAQCLRGVDHPMHLVTMGVDG